MPLPVHDEFRGLNRATTLVTCRSPRTQRLFRARRVEPFASVTGPRLSLSHPGEPRATTRVLLLVQTLNIESLQLALETEDLTLGLYR